MVKIRIYRQNKLWFNAWNVSTIGKRIIHIIFIVYFKGIMHIISVEFALFDRNVFRFSGYFAGLNWKERCRNILENERISVGITWA